MTTKNKKEIQQWDQIPKAKTKLLTKNPDVSQRLKDAEKNYTPTQSIKLLKKLYNHCKEKIKKGLKPDLHDDLFNILSHPDLLRIAFNKLSKNKGALTPGTTGSTAETENEQTIQQLSLELRQGTFKWSRIRRVFIPKPGKLVKRPLGLPDFNNKMVQEAIRIVLDAIYEPEFQQLNCNFGFRPGKCCQQSIRNIRQKAQFNEFTIEGDIKGAYDNVNHSVLMRILRLRIRDRKFLKLIYTGLKTGLLDNGLQVESYNGVPQGGICSPILFNIYMHEFDKFIINKIIPKYTKILPTTKDINPLYSAYASPIRSVRSRIAREKAKEGKTVFYHPNQPRFNVSRIQILENEKKILIQLRENAKIPYNTPEQKTPQIFYQRYADDFIVCTSGTLENANNIKNEISEFLWNELKLQLSPDKTKITNTKKSKIRYLGFEIYHYKNSRLVFKTKRSTGTLFKQSIRSFTSGIDKERLLNRFITKGFLEKPIPKKPIIPREIGWLTVLSPQEIIIKYNQMMMGIGIYYIGEIANPSELNRWHYILYYSCLKTLAAKLKISTSKIIKKYGYKDISIHHPKSTKKIPATDYRICFKYTINSKDDKWITLLNYKEFMFKMLSYKNEYLSKVISSEVFPDIKEIDFGYMNKTNWRTAFKYTTYCGICGAPPPLENHHIKEIKHSGGKFKGFNGFDKLVAALGRKQMPVCIPCHNSITHGKYNGLKLESLYDVRLTTTPINIPSEIHPDPSEKVILPRTIIEINEIEKTYLNTLYRTFQNNK